MAILRNGREKLAPHKLGLKIVHGLHVWSPAFAPGKTLPASATAEGAGVPPAIDWSGAPSGTQSFAVLVEDPDAPMADAFVHWVVYAIPANAKSLEPASLRLAQEGKNSTRRSGFTPAAPPRGHGLHHYHFQVFALDAPVALGQGAGSTELVEAMRGHVLAWGETVGTYARP